MTSRQPSGFLLLAYRMPAKPPAGRVAVWRNLKKLGAVYVQDSVCVLPDTASLRRELVSVVARVDDGGGRYHLLPLRKLPAEEEEKLVSLFLEQSADHYREIIEDCEVNFVKEIEFERFRKNFTYEEAEEIRMEFEKISVWFDRVTERDWFGASNREEARTWLSKCEKMLEEFEATVFEVNSRDAKLPRALRVLDGGTGLLEPSDVARGRPRR